MRISARLCGVGVAVLAVLLAVVACDSESSSPSSSGTSSASSDDHVRPTLPPPIRSSPDSVSLTTRVLRVWELPGQPDWVVRAGGLIWLKRDDGIVSAIDPDRADFVASIETGYSAEPACQGLAFDGDRLWTCAGENRIVALDPETVTADAPIRVPRLSDQTRFPIADGQIWLIGASARSLVGVNIDRGDVQTRISLNAFCIDLARDETGESTFVYAVCPTAGQVVAVDVESGSVESRTRLPDARVAELGRSGLWVTFDGGVAQLAVPNLSVEAVYDLPVGLDSGLFAADDAVWVRMAGRQMLARIDLASRQVEEIVTSTKYQSIGDLIVVGDDIWTTASDDSVLLRVSAI